MPRTILRLVPNTLISFILSGVWLLGPARAEDPRATDVPLPPPTPLPGQPAVIPGPPPPRVVVLPGDLPPVIHVPGPYPGTETVIYTRPSAYDVWRNYGIDRRGVPRPLVVMTPAGSFYRANGRPYNLESVKPNVVMPYATD